MVAHGTENGLDADNGIALDDTDDPGLLSDMRYLTVDPYQSGVLYAATSDKVYKSIDYAATWQVMPDSGFINNEILVLAAGRNSTVYAGAGNWIFSYEEGRWNSISDGLSGGIVHDIVKSGEAMFAACDSGLYRTKAEPENKTVAFDKSNSYAEGMPSISSVQKAAIEFGDVDISKIETWRRQSRHKALLPSVGVGVNRDNSELWHWEGGSTTRDNDDILRKGKDSFDWDVSLNWDLGELIWSNDQTSIDARARLLVQLRDDILDEVTKLYFEYARSRLELDSLAIGDTRKLAEKQIRLQEFAAQLDGLTDGYFTGKNQCR